MVVLVDDSIADNPARTTTVDNAVKGRVEPLLDANRIVVMVPRAVGTPTRTPQRRRLTRSDRGTPLGLRP
jgi:hypothetical protein